VSLSVTDDKTTAVEVFRKYDRTALPVVDTHGRLAGIVTLDDVLDVAEEEATRSIQKFGGLEALDEPYMSTPLLAMVRKRATWLVILFVGEMLTATAMGFFQDEIARAVVLALFVPLIISSGGNSGSQAATLIIRALALGEVTLRDWWRVLRREIVAGLLLGSILAAIGFVRIAVWNAVMPSGCDLRLMSSVNDVNDIPRTDTKLTIVAAVNDVLYFRTFDGDGKLIVDTDERKLTTHARQIEDLKKQLADLWPPHQLTSSEKGRIQSALTSIVGQNLPSLYGRYWLLVAVTVSVSLVGVVLWGSLTGSMLPFLLRRLGFDPATSSAPFVATLVDVTGLIIYFSVAIMVLHNTLL
jgi:Mg/Co/Ni transporter MgtE